MHETSNIPIRNHEMLLLYLSHFSITARTYRAERIMSQNETGTLCNSSQFPDVAHCFWRQQTEIFTDANGQTYRVTVSLAEMSLSKSIEI